jgi:hypothetical protein
VTARLLLHTLRLETLGEEVTRRMATCVTPSTCRNSSRQGIDAELLDERLGTTI